MAGENNDKGVGDADTGPEFARFIENAQPAWIKDGKGIRGDGKPGFPRPALTERNRTDQPRGDVRRGDVQGPFPIEEAQAAGAQITESLTLNCSFLLVDATIDVDGEPSNRVLVMDGKINGQFPAGMSAGNYILDLADPADSIIYAGVSFNPTTLAILDRYLGVSGSGDFPPSVLTSTSVGTLNWQLGFTYFNADGVFTIYQTLLGDINFAFTYGSYNTHPALLPVKIDSGQPGWLDASVFL